MFYGVPATIDDIISCLFFALLSSDLDGQIHCQVMHRHSKYTCNQQGATRELIKVQFSTNMYTL
jgi:hypothetical protein